MHIDAEEMDAAFGGGVLGFTGHVTEGLDHVSDNGPSPQKSGLPNFVM